MLVHSRAWPQQPGALGDICLIWSEQLLCYKSLLRGHALAVVFLVRFSVGRKHQAALYLSIAGHGWGGHCFMDVCVCEWVCVLKVGHCVCTFLGSCSAILATAEAAFAFTVNCWALDMKHRCFLQLIKFWLGVCLPCFLPLFALVSVCVGVCPWNKCRCNRLLWREGFII